MQRGEKAIWMLVSSEFSQLHPQPRVGIELPGQLKIISGVGEFPSLSYFCVDHISVFMAIFLNPDNREI